MVKVALGVIAIAAVVVLVLVFVVGDDDGGGQSGEEWKPVAGLRLTEPKQIYRNEDGVLNVRLEAKPDLINVSDRPLNATPFNGRSLDGPTMHVRPGDTINVNFVNELGVDKDGKGIPTNIHYHGLHVSPLGVSDNIFRTFDNGKTYKSSVVIPRGHSRGTFWYHVHLHGISQGQVMNGLSGLLVIEGIEQQLPDSLRNVPDRQLALRDVQTKGDAILGPNDINPNKASTRLVNSLYQPRFEMSAGRYEHWRLANIGANVFYELKLDDPRRGGRVPFAVIAEDGESVWRVERKGTLLLPPGKRFDVLVRPPRPGVYVLQSLPYAQHSVQKAGDPPAITQKPVPVNADGKPETQTLATISATPAANAGAPAQRLPKSLHPSGQEGYDLSRDDVRVDNRQEFRFNYFSTDTEFAAQINGQTFNPTDDPAVSPVLRETQEWRLVNLTGDDHPFHIHVNPFQVISVNGKPYHANGYQDVVNLPKQYIEDGKLKNGEVVIRQRFTDYDGWFVFHCHILQHEDLGMMATIQTRRTAKDPVKPPPTAGHQRTPQELPATGPELNETPDDTLSEHAPEHGSR
jgi:suppressor of ftsI